jgi:hypothetical protein
MLWLEAPSAGFEVVVGESSPIAAISTTCANVAGATATATVNGRSVALTNRGDGLYTGSYVPSAVGSVTVTVTASSGGQTTTRTVSGTAVKNYRFVDDKYTGIVAGGTRLTLGDDTAATVTLPFSFSLYEQSFTSVKVSSNGYLVFGASAATRPFNVSIPDSTAPNGFVAPYWDDLDPSAGGAVWHSTEGAAPNRKFVVSWIDVPQFRGNNGVTFQVILEEATGDAVFQYADSSFGDASLDHGASATVGVEGVDGVLAPGEQITIRSAVAPGRAFHPPATSVTLQAALSHSSRYLAPTVVHFLG